jgi:hypothetical protein
LIPSSHPSLFSLSLILLTPSSPSLFSHPLPPLHRWRNGRGARGTRDLYYLSPPSQNIFLHPCMLSLIPSPHSPLLTSPWFTTPPHTPPHPPWP